MPGELPNAGESSPSGLASSRPSKQLQQQRHPKLELVAHLPSSYGSFPSPTKLTNQQSLRADSPTHFSLSNLLMGSEPLDEKEPVASPTSENSDTSSLAGDNIQEGEGATVAVEEGANNNQEEEEEEDGVNDIGASPNHMIMVNMINTILSPIINRLLQQKVAADRLEQYPLLEALSLNGRYACLAFLAAYLILVLLLWLPLWILAQIITEIGCYIFLLTSFVYGGRCLLRLLAFPGTNVKVYGEIENEFAKYSCRMLEGAAGALEDFAKSVRAGSSPSESSSDSPKAHKLLGLDDNDGWDIVDVPATYKRVKVYKNRVLGAYHEVLHCLLEENGQGSSGNKHLSAQGASRNGFYDRLGDNIVACRDTCKRNSWCCERSTSNGGDLSSSNRDGNDCIQVDASLNCPSPSNSAGVAGGLDRRSSTTQWGNNRLVGDIGNMGNLTAQARADGRELYDLLTSVLNDLSALESSASNTLRNMDDKDQLKKSCISEETARHATRVVHRANELRELVSRIKIKSLDGDNDDDQDENEEEEVGAEAVRHRLEEQGTASSSTSTLDMIKSAAQAFVSMIDPPPHNSIFGLDVIRGCFLARYHGASQFWVKRGAGSSFCGGDGRLDVIMIPSLTRSNNNQGNDASIESLLPLSPRKGRDDEIVGGISSNIGKKRKAMLYCNPNAGLVEVATGMGLTGGNVDSGADSDDDKEP